MKISKKYIIEKVMSENKDRYTLTTGMIRKRGGGYVAEATNGRIAVLVPVEMDENDKPGRITREALRLARTKANLGIIKATDQLELKNGWKLPRPAEKELGNFPDIEQVIPKESARKEMVFSINPTFLKNLADAMGAETITLYVPTEKPDAIRISAVDMHNLAIGVIMPVHAMEGLWGIKEPVEKNEVASAK